jgi:CheY-like chemotaxis protein
MTIRILVVDDEPDVADLVRQNFRRDIRGGIYSFDFALSGEQALHVLRHGVPPEVVMLLSDINMPGMTGIALLETVRREWPAIRVCMITAYGDAATEARVLGMGAGAFLTKPVDFVRLRQQLAETLAAPP